MKDPYIGQWFECQSGLGKVILNAGTYYKCIIFGEMILITWRSSKETKLLKFLNCPEYYDLMVDEIELWESYVQGLGPKCWISARSKDV